MEGTPMAMQVYNTTSRPRSPATPTTVSAYCDAGHTTTEAAAYFGVSDRYIRKMKARHVTDNADAQTPARPAQTPQDPPNVPNAPILPLEPQTPHYATVAASDVARDGQLWKCPICGEMMAPLPGTTGATWREHGCYICSTPRSVRSVMTTEAEQNSGTSEPTRDGTPEPEPQIPSPCLDVPPEPEHTSPTPIHGTVPPFRPYMDDRPRSISTRSWATPYRPQVPSITGIYDRLSVGGLEQVNGAPLAIVLAAILIALSYAATH
jgi:hypothetical protein